MGGDFFADELFDLELGLGEGQEVRAGEFEGEREAGRRGARLQGQVAAGVRGHLVQREGGQGLLGAVGLGREHPHLQVPVVRQRDRLLRAQVVATPHQHEVFIVSDL